MSFRPIFGIPRLTQDWGTEQHERETHWTSLFYDLMVVAALNAIAEPFEEAEEPEGEELRFLQEVQGSTDGTDGTSDTVHEQELFLLTPIKHLWLCALLQFVSVVNPWNFLNEFTSMFEDESFIGHISFFVHAFGLAATTAGCVGELEENYKVLANGIILAKIGLLVLYARPLIYVKRARTHILVRAVSHCVNIALMLWAITCPYETFRTLLIISSFWDWAGLFFLLALNKEQRIPIHIQSYADRIKEVTMVIFGEAIFAIILQPYSEAKKQTHFYIALASTLWMIYAMALQEFHILPNDDDHALRRSVVFGYLWYFTNFFKQFCLLGTSIGIKRAHLLMFKAPLQPIDQDTRRLIVWGLSMNMLSVQMIRSYSFGFGRHPNKDDPPKLYRLKVLWWTIMIVAVLAPQLVDFIILEHVSAQPLVVLISFGCLMSLVIMGEAAMSNLVAEHLRRLMQELDTCGGGGEPGEMTYLHSSSAVRQYSSSEDVPQEQSHPHKCAFPMEHCPTKAKPEES
ncbi:expressed unknown protein [Seminavis robusta]|uniref:Uncharacterized protein n=1 Tax=Seminavis robusta TaxID=568900 RepID=A0A9N8E0K5_9STRA|nr:expressed unknown protein [Seminavis robusta]|eukprot:Sro505_g156130.1 n/a (514) ;mRNA; r:21296-22936